MIVRRDYRNNLSIRLELMLYSFSYLVMSQIMEHGVARQNAVVISHPRPAMLVIKISRINPIVTNYNIVEG